MAPLATDNSDSRRFLSRRLGVLAGAAVLFFALGFGAAFLVWLLIGGGVWRGDVQVLGAELRSPSELALVVDSCRGNPDVTLFRETDLDVQVKVVASSTTFRGGRRCGDIVEIQLQEPLGDRVVVDKHTGNSVSVRTFK